MDRNETKSILDIIIRAYPRMKVVETKEDVDLWHECLEDLEYPKARKATIDIVKRTKDFPPDIATIREEYEKIAAAERHEIGEIRRFYEQARSYYPGCGDVGYGWKEFYQRAKTKTDAERLQNLIISYVQQIDREGKDEVIDFAECIKTVKYDKGIITCEKALSSSVGEQK